MDKHSQRLAAAWGTEIATRRKLAGLSRAHLAEELEVSREIVRLWEAGEHLPSPRMQSVLIDRLSLDTATIARLIDLTRGAA